MASARTPLNHFSVTLSRLEEKFQSIYTHFEELEEAAGRLTRQLEQHSKNLAQQAYQDQVWLSLLEERLTTVEMNLFFTYVTDALRSCHTLTLRKLPDLAPSLPTIASVLRRKVKNQRICNAWASALNDLGLHSSHITALCAFFVTYGYQADYYNVEQRQKYTGMEETLISKVVSNEVLRDGLLKAVDVVKKGRAGTSDVPAICRLP